MQSTRVPHIAQRDNTRGTSAMTYDYDRVAAKVYSVMRVNTLSPEGIEPVHWSTPDKTPHQAMWLWDSCFHAIGACSARVDRRILSVHLLSSYYLCYGDTNGGCSGTTFLVRMLAISADTPSAIPSDVLVIHIDLSFIV